MPYSTVGTIARELDVPPKMISDLFYARRLDDKRCPIFGRTRLVPEDYVPEVKRIVRAEEARKLAKKSEAIHAGV